MLPPSNPASNLQNFDLHPLITYPGLTQEMLDYEIQVIRKIFERIFFILQASQPVKPFLLDELAHVHEHRREIWSEASGKY